MYTLHISWLNMIRMIAYILATPMYIYIGIMFYIELQVVYTCICL